MSKIAVEFCGFNCPNPFLLAASPVARSSEMILRAFDRGWGGAITKSLALSQNDGGHSLSPRFTRYNQSMGNIDFRIDKTAEETVHDWAKIKKEFPDRFLAISIKEGTDEKSWRLLTKMAISTSPDAIELCLSCPEATDDASCIASGQSPDNYYQRIIGWVRKETDLPIIVKLTPVLNDPLPVATAIASAGGNALSVANTMKSIAGINLDTMVPEPIVDAKSNYVGLSGPALKPLTLRLVAEVACMDIKNLNISGVGGVRYWTDAVEYLLLGASTVQVATEIMYRGYGIVEELKDGLTTFMENNGYNSVHELVGNSLNKLQPTRSLNQDYRVVAKFDHDTCIGCGRCYVSCQDGAYQAIDFDSSERLPVFREEDCHGCGLCSLVCPVPNCIVMEKSTVPFPTQNKELKR